MKSFLLLAGFTGLIPLLGQPVERPMAAKQTSPQTRQQASPFPIGPQKGACVFGQADQLIEFAQAQKKRVRG